MHRRRFLGLAAAGAGAAILAACSSDGDGTAASTTRKAGAGSTTTSRPPTTTATVPDAQGITKDPFTLGVASGDPLPDSVVLWTRLAPDPVALDGAGGMEDRTIQVLWEVAEDEAFTKLVASGIEEASPEFAHSIHAEPTGLDPDTWYFYRFRLGDLTSPVGRTRTTPEPGAKVDQLKLAFASCQLRGQGYWTAYTQMVADEPDLVFFLGDYIYEYPVTDGPFATPLDHEPEDLADYRVLYAAYKRDELIQAAHAAAPWVVTWDDHEVQNNYAADVPAKEDDAPTFDARRRAAYQSYWEHQPLRLDPPKQDGAITLYRTVSWGRLAEFFVLDGRQYRSDQVCGDQVGTNRKECTEIDDPDHTMLGTEQEAWLLGGLDATKATWPVLAQQTVMKALVLGDIVLNVDQWDGYPAERARILRHIDEHDIDNVMILTGDIHAGAAADIRSPDAGLTGPIVAHELIGPGISSAGFAALAKAVDPKAIGVAYVNAADNGYVRCTVTPERWTTDFVVMDTIKTPDGKAGVAATVVVDAGTPGLRRV